MVKYNSFPKEAYSTNGCTILSLLKQEIYKIKKWRNAQLDVLRQKNPLTDKEQEYYFNHFIYPTYQQEFPQQILFSIVA